MANISPSMQIRINPSCNKAYRNDSQLANARITVQGLRAQLSALADGFDDDDARVAWLIGMQGQLAEVERAIVDALAGGGE